MDLALYISQRGISVAEFGRLIGVANRQTIHKYVTGKRFPPPETLVRIREVTDGKVTADDLAQHHAFQAPSDAVA